MQNHTFVASHPHLRLGRKQPTQHRMLRFHDIAAATCRTAQEVRSFDYHGDLPPYTGYLLNNELGCCTSAAKYHRLQMMTMKLKGEFLGADVLNALVLRLYEGSCGYVPGDASTDTGGEMPTIASYLTHTGMPMPGGGMERYAAAFEIDVSNMVDLSYCGDICGGIDLGIQVTTSVMPADGSQPPEIWDVADGDTVVGGHDIYAMARLNNGNWVVNSWGSFYQLTPAFWAANVQEAYAYVSKDWVEATGKTPLGMSVDAWASVMREHASVV